MKKFHFIKKIHSIGAVLFVGFSLISFLFFIMFLIIFSGFSEIFALLCFFTLFLICLILLITTILDLKKTYEIGNGKLEFDGKYPRYIKTIADSASKNADKYTKHIYDVSSIPFVFITKNENTRFGGVRLKYKEKIDGKKLIMEQMYLFNKFVYDEKRCCDRFAFELLNRNGDYKSQFYETLCSMYYQEEVLNELYINGFCGEIFISKDIYAQRKQSFDQMFAKYQVTPEKIHVVI